jgi:hypothetical protein
MEDDASSLDPFLVIPNIPAWVRLFLKLLTVSGITKKIYALKKISVKL